MSIDNHLISQRDLLEQTHRLRQLRNIQPLQRPLVKINGAQVIDFCSNDYLGLAQHPVLIEAAKEALAKWGIGSCGSRLIGGSMPCHQELEERVAVFKNTDAALVFNSGYQANLGILSALAGPKDNIFMDRLCHASQIDGAILSRAKLNRYANLDLEDLERQLKTTPTSGQRFIVTESVFSMDGDCAPLASLFALADAYDTWLIVDEAHATGLYGNQRRSGVWEAQGLPRSHRVILMGTFGKALGSFGAYVAGSEIVIQSLTQTARSFIYSTALPSSVIGVNIAALDLVMNNPCFTQQLWQNIQAFHSLTQAWNLPWQGESPIIPLIVGDDVVALKCSQMLLEQGFYVHAIRPPSVPEGSARLRLTLSAGHTPTQIEALAEALKTTLNIAQLTSSKA